MRDVCLISGLGCAVFSMAAAFAGAAAAQEQIAYVYDVHGRVVQLTHCGSVNANRETTYEYDLADNRTERVRDTSGSCPITITMLEEQPTGEDHVEMAAVDRAGAGNDGGAGRRERGVGPAAYSPDPLLDR